MERIWAPWRSAYITGKEEKEGGCVLCNHSRAEKQVWRERGILYRDDHAYVVLNKYPYTGGHLMVVPHRHVKSPLALERDEYTSVTLLLRDAIDKVEQAFTPHGLNVGMNLGRPAGAGIEQHCHFHVVPRWNGDTNFMSVLSDMRVVSQSLMETYDVLKPFFEPE